MDSINTKKILFFTENYERGGGNRYLYDLACLAKNKNTELVVFSNCFGLEPAEIAWFNELEIPYRQIAILSWGELRTKYNLRKQFLKKLIYRIIYLPMSVVIRLYQLFLFLHLLKLEKPDLIVCANGGYPAGGAVNRFLLSGSILKIRCFYSVVNVPSTNCWDKFRMLIWDHLIPSAADKVIVDSKQIKKQLTPHGFSEDKMTVLYNGLNGTLPYSMRTNKKTKILFFARLEEIKGIEFLVRAIRELNGDLLENTEYHFYGDGTLAPIIKKLASDYSSNVFYHGFFEGNFQSIFCSADIYVLPSLMEGLPYTVLEAMKTGCCIISTNVGGLPEMIDSGISGLLVEPKNFKALASALRKLILDPEQREKMGKAAKDKFDSQFEQTAIFKMHSGLFDI
jgi:glycosyltransferase involved in cell wall biosynthesis